MKMVICVKSYDHFETRVRFLGLLEQKDPASIDGEFQKVSCGVLKS